MKIKKIACGLLISIATILSFSTSYALENCKNPILSGPPVWPPFVEAGTEAGSGPAYEFATDILSSLGSQPILDQKRPWPRVLREFERGKIDILVAILYSEERAKKFHMTDAWTNDFYGIITLKDTKIEAKKLDDLLQYHGGYYAGIRFKEPYASFVNKKVKLDQIGKVDSLYRMLNSKRIDYLIASIPSFQRLTPEGMSAKDYKNHSQFNMVMPVHMAVSDNSPCKVFISEINDKMVQILDKKNYVPAIIQ